MDDFKTFLAKAIAAAPTVEEGLRLWNTPQPPDIASVLASSVSSGSLVGVKCCAIKAEDRLTLEQQSEAICRWRQSPTTARAMDEKTEWSIGNELARTGLIEPSMTISDKSKSSGQEWGPLAWCADRFMPHAALGLLQGFDQPDPDDMANALSACLKKMATTRKDDDAWVALLQNLLDRGADPTLESAQRKATEPGAARSVLITMAKTWCNRPEPLLARLVGDASWLTNETINGFTPLLQWIIMGGDEEVILRLANGQAMGVDGVLRLVDRYIANTTKQDTNLFATLPRFISLPAIPPEVAVHGIVVNWQTALSSSRPNYPERILYKAGLMLCRCAAVEHQEELVAFLDEIHSLMGPVKPKNDKDLQRAKEQLGTFSQAWRLDRASPQASGLRQTPRL